jgi:hypothetical protein
MNLNLNLYDHFTQKRHNFLTQNGHRIHDAVYDLTNYA